MTTSNEIKSNKLIQMDYDVVYNVEGKQIIQTRRREMTRGERQAKMYIFDPSFEKAETVDFIWKVYPVFGNYEGFLPANSSVVKITSKERFDSIVSRIENDKKLHP